MSSANNPQTDPGPHDDNADVRVDVRVTMRIDVHIHVDDSPQDPSEGLNSDQPQQSNQNDEEENDHAATGPDGEQQHQLAQTPAPIVLSELARNPPSWPADGFDDDDPATAHMVNVLQSVDMLAVTPSAIEDIIIITNPITDRRERGVPAIAQLFRRQAEDGDDCNFFFPYPDDPGQLAGKVDCSKVGLTIVIQALQEVVRNSGETLSIKPLSHHIDRLNAADGKMRYTRPRLWVDCQTHIAFVDPFTPEGAREAAAALQAAAPDPSSDHVLFLTGAPPAAGRHVLGQQREAVLAVYQAIGNRI